MRFHILNIVVGFAAAAVAVAPLQPSEDPFYQPPAGFETTAPGTILRSRTIVPAFLGLILDPVETWQVLYRTTAINGTPIATVTTIFKPAFAALDKFVSFHTAEDSSYVNCAPSYNYQLLAEQTNAIVSAEFLVIQAYLASGYVVSSPDYESFDAAFGPGHLEGMGVLDSMRAVNNYASTLGLTSSNNSIVGVGYSGGAIATGWAAALQSIYAPELAVKGWAAGGTPANLTGTALFLSNTTFAGFVPAAFDGLAKPNAYGATLEPVYDQYITPYGQSILDYANENCGTAVLFVFAGKSVFSYDFQTLGPAILSEPHVTAVLQQNILGINETELPIAPVYLYHSVTDEVIPYANASTLYDNWCEQGADVQFTTFGSGGHLTTEIYGLPGALNFVKSAFAGTVPKACSKKTILDNVLNPLALLSDLEPILVALLNGLLQLQQADNGDLTALSKPIAA